MRLRECGERQDVGFGLGHHRGLLREAARQGAGDAVPLGGDLLRVGVSEDRLDRRGHRRGVLGRYRGVQIRMECTRQRCHDDPVNCCATAAFNPA